MALGQQDSTGIPVENLGFVVKEDTGNRPTPTENTRSLARS